MPKTTPLRTGLTIALASLAIVPAATASAAGTTTGAPSASAAAPAAAHAPSAHRWCRPHRCWHGGGGGNAA